MADMRKPAYDEDGLPTDWIDPVYTKEFNKGYFHQMKEEKKLKRLATKNMKAYQYGGDNTNWNQTAVSDEDDLEEEMMRLDREDETLKDDDDEEEEEVEEEEDDRRGKGRKVKKKR